MFVHLSNQGYMAPDCRFEFFDVSILTARQGRSDPADRRSVFVCDHQLKEFCDFLSIVSNYRLVGDDCPEIKFTLIEKCKHDRCNNSSVFCQTIMDPGEEPSSGLFCFGHPNRIPLMFDLDESEDLVKIIKLFKLS